MEPGNKDKPLYVVCVCELELYSGARALSTTNTLVLISLMTVDLLQELFS